MRALLLLVLLAVTPALPPKPAAPITGSYVISVSTIACAFPSSHEQKIAMFDARYCSKISEQVVTEPHAPDARVLHVEKLTIEDVAVKLEALLGGEEGDDVD